jgi:type I restriction enzyme S subunit
LGSSSTVPGINRDQILKTIIPIPSIEEQNYICQEIESRFSLIDKITFTVDQSLIQAKQIRQSILKKAFEGKLVPQDPADEPAAKLMERIKAEADKQKTKKRIKSHKETIKQSRLV